MGVLQWDAAVAERDSIRFINGNGQKTISKSFPRDYSLGYVFHGEYCLMGDGQGGIGLIDKAGKWAVNPEYDEVVPATRNYWKMRKGIEDSELWYRQSLTCQYGWSQSP